MIRGTVILVTVASLCLGSVAYAADLPQAQSPAFKPRVKMAAIPAKAIFKKSSPLLKTNGRLAKLEPVAPAQKTDLATPPTTQQAAIEPDGNEVDMSWVLEPLVAHADGGKTEGSASVEGNLIVVEPGHVTSDNMMIELSGHIVKTADTTARIDVQIGGTRRSTTWKSEDVQSGRFKIELNAPAPTGKLPNYFPVSAMAFVTKDGKSGAVMVSLDKIVVHLGKVRMAGSQ